jgi:DNA-binding NarL/FixJ family response regulator
MSTVAVVVADLMFQSRIREAAAALAQGVAVADDAASLDAALASEPALAIIDLHIGGIDAPDAIVRAKAVGARVLAFGRHTEPQTLRAARAAGADTVVARSQLVEELPQLIEALLRQP